MNALRHTSMLAMAVVAIAFAATARAQDGKGDDAVSNKALQAKLLYCKTCHGLDGQGFRGASTMPRLAGQPVEYIENQLAAFSERRRSNKFMYGVSHVLSPAMRKALAEHFSSLNPKPLGGGGASPALAAEGKKIFQQGIGKTDVPACASCHGADAKGNGQFPRLAGQLNDYIIAKLTNWDKERGQDPNNPDASSIMQPIAHSLTKDQIAAVASYLSTLQ